MDCDGRHVLRGCRHISDLEIAIPLPILLELGCDNFQRFTSRRGQCPLNPKAWRQDNLGWLSTHLYVRIDGPILLENPFYEPAAPPAYELYSAWFLIALSMPEKISA